MGILQGKVVGDTFIVIDSFALPVEGTETRVNAQAEAYEYMVDFLDTSKVGVVARGGSEGQGGAGNGWHRWIGDAHRGRGSVKPPSAVLHPPEGLAQFAAFMGIGVRSLLQDVYGSSRGRGVPGPTSHSQLHCCPAHPAALFRSPCSW